MADEMQAAYEAFRPPARLGFCTRCGHAVHAYPANEAQFSSDYHDDYADPLKVSGDHGESLSAYECLNCQTRWVAVSSGDTGTLFSCGHWGPAYADFCAVCGERPWPTP